MTALRSHAMAKTLSRTADASLYEEDFTLLEAEWLPQSVYGLDRDRF